jgi:hypothetical protein
LLSPLSLGPLSLLLKPLLVELLLLGSSVVELLLLELLDEPVPAPSRLEGSLDDPLPDGVAPELPRLELLGVELLPEESATPNALAVLLSSCPLVWIFCARWKARNACCVRGPMTPSIGPGLCPFPFNAS